jgi:DNA-binding response OmpR family regulator
MLSARGEEYDKIHGFELGIDDYVVKPFSPKELMLRLNVLITRNRKAGQDTPGERDLVRVGGLTVDFTGRMVFIDSRKIELSPKEYDLLFFLVRNRNIALSRDKLLAEVWGYEFFGDDRTLDTHIKLLRASLGEYRRLIVTLRGVGYRFEAD